MVKRKSKKTKGFTLIELLIVIVIIGILVSIATPNFLAARERAYRSSLKTNMHIVQSMAETYSIDWGALYPDTMGVLEQQAKIREYWTDITNPLTSAIDSPVDISQYTSDKPYKVIFAGSKSGNPPGYDVSSVYTGNIGLDSYVIYGTNREGIPFRVKNQIFYYSNF